MSLIDKEIQLLYEKAAADELPKYPEIDSEDSFYADIPSGKEYMTVHFSGENDALEASLKSLWRDDEKLRECIPLVLAAVEKCRVKKENAIEHTELYNYTM